MSFTEWLDPEIFKRIWLESAEVKSSEIEFAFHHPAVVNLGGKEEI